jgi:2-polyprenyl-3-methyl-5-hydroxy-6-metoxy-1,4-benzoquinol methylase
VLGDFSQRSNEQEIMDGGIGSFELFDESLKQIEAVNHLTLGYRPLLSWVDRQLQSPKPRPVTILDVGCGRGDLLRRIWSLARKKTVTVRLTGVDIDSWSAPAARQATPEYMGIDYRIGNVFDMDIEADFIVCSHVTHHMKNDELVAFIRWLEAHARRGWFIGDLHRHPISFILAKMFLWLAPVNSMIRNDGPVSVARAFTAKDWREILKQAGVPAQIRWYFPFRYGVARCG